MFTARNRELLLVVEDDPIARQGLTFLLVGAGYEVAPAAHGQEALAYLNANPPPDLILLDMLTPVLDGWGVLEELRRPGSPAASVPVLVVTVVNLSRAWALAAC